MYISIGLLVNSIILKHFPGFLSKCFKALCIKLTVNKKVSVNRFRNILYISRSRAQLTRYILISARFLMQHTINALREKVVYARGQGCLLDSCIHISQIKGVLLYNLFVAIVTTPVSRLNSSKLCMGL